MDMAEGRAEISRGFVLEDRIYMCSGPNSKLEGECVIKSENLTQLCT